MLAKKILENLKKGNYRIELCEECDCGFYWEDKDDVIKCRIVNNGGCFYHNALIMDDLAGQFDEETIIDCDGVIALYDNDYGISLQILCKNEAIIKQIKKIFWENTKLWCDFVASINFPSKHGCLHEDRRIKSLLEYAQWRVDISVNR